LKYEYDYKEFFFLSQILIRHFVTKTHFLAILFHSEDNWIVAENDIFFVFSYFWKGFLVTGFGG